MEDVEDGDDIERAFPKEELVEVYQRLKSGDRTAFDMWCMYFAVMAACSAGKCAGNAYGFWHEDLYEERKSAACIVAANIGREVMEGTLDIEGEPENYVWASIRYKMIESDKKDRAKGATRSKAGWQAKRSKFNEVEIPVRSNATQRIWEEVLASCDTPFEREVVSLFAQNGDDPQAVSRVLDMAIHEVQNCRGIILERYAARMREQGSPSPALEKQAKTLKGIRPRRKQSNDWEKTKPMASKAVKPSLQRV
jgi:hypothetical protein